MTSNDIFGLVLLGLFFGVPVLTDALCITIEVVTDAIKKLKG